MDSEDLVRQPSKRRAVGKKSTSDKSSILTPQSTPSTTPQQIHTTSLMDSDEELNSSMSTGEEFMEDEDSELSSGDGRLIVPLQFLLVLLITDLRIVK